MDESLVMGQLLEFEVAFPGETKLSIEEYLSGGSREVILTVATFLLGFKNHKSKFEDNKEFLRMFFQTENYEFAKDVYQKIDEIARKGVRPVIVNTYSSLKLFEHYFSKTEELETQTKLEFEVNLFKAYLVLNSDFTMKQYIAFTSVEESGKELKFPMMSFCMQYPVSDKTNYNIDLIWVTQMVKSIYLFQFLESHEQTMPLLAAFLAYFNCSTWEEYLKRLLPLTEAAIRNEREAHTDIVVNAGEGFEQSCAFIEKIMIQENDELEKNDFLTIRAKPFYKVKKGVYRIIFNLFVVEKVFKGIYFFLRDINKTLPASNRIKDVRGFYGDEFSEKVLCYKIIESIYPDKCIRFTGKELADRKIDAAPDYYIRKGKNILLIESKDFLIAADKKMTFDFNVYEAEFGRVLDYEEMHDGKIKPKAIMQLINCIRRILKKEFTADTDYYYKDVFIYPVLLTHDHQYDTPGFNELIDFWFQDALLDLKGEGLFIHRIKPLSVVNIDSLIYNQAGLANSIPLHKILELYHENKKMWKPKKTSFKSQVEYRRYFNVFKQMRMSKLIPFSLFLDKYFHKYGLSRPTSLLEAVAPSLFKEEFQAKIVKSNE